MNGLQSTRMPIETMFFHWDVDEGELLTEMLTQDTVSPHLQSWLRTQAINVTRHAAALKPFSYHEFGTSAASPAKAHLQAANHLINSLRSQLKSMAQQVGASTTEAIESPQQPELRRLLTQKDRAQAWVKLIEKIWDFYFEIFNQRRTRFANWLLGCDRIALDCYQVIYTHLGVAKSIPTPGPFSYMETGFTPSTFRRGIPLSKLGKQINPFPLIYLPYHRLVNPWTLGAILHEVSHDLQTDLNLRQAVPRAIARSLLKAGMSRFVTFTWCRWHSEAWADMCGLLLGGPVMMGSLMDIAARSPQVTLYFQPRKPHPTPYLRIFILAELLRRMGFAREAEAYCRMWHRIYPHARAGNIPGQILETFDRAKRIVVDTLAFTPYPQLGDKTLVQATGKFTRKHQKMVQEAGQRIATGNDPGIIPERFLIGASRWALNQKLATPETITSNFYQALVRR
ncbi:MAG: hypothetical protein QNJ36_01855 [Calothrix sp. MO_167.B42]|nr:hypothetical protein [Calothrix sp. MO_167.B42]